jgi:hypothetical protein
MPRGLAKETGRKNGPRASGDGPDRRVYRGVRLFGGRSLTSVRSFARVHPPTQILACPEESG